MTTQRLERLSVLQELTVAALELFEPTRSVDLFLERVAERLGCSAALWLVWADDEVALLGAAGLSRLSCGCKISRPATADWASISLPYAELARASVVRWAFELTASDSARNRHGLLLCFAADAKVLPQFRPMVDRLVEVLRVALSHRQLLGDLRDSYEALEKAQQALLQGERLAAVGQLSAVVAHEVRNPLGSILNCLRSLERSSQRSGEELRLLKIAKDEAGQIDRIVTDLLDFAKPGEVSLRPLSVEQVIASSVEAAQRAHDWPPGATVRLEVAAPLPVAQIDADLLRQAVINLVNNGLQAMPTGGEVTVRLAEETHLQRRWIRIDVVDQGAGISAELRDRIFEPFFSTRASGSGLGLAIVKRIVDAHRGEVALSSELLRGSTFTIRLPLEPG